MAVWALLAMAVGCSGSSTDSGKEVSIRLTVDNAAGFAVVDTFTFSFAAEGRALQGVELIYGDGDTESISGAGAGKTTGTRIHAYQEAGTYTAVARAVEMLGGEAADTVIVQVQ